MNVEGTALDEISALVNWQLKQGERLEPLCNHIYRNCICTICNWGAP